MDYKFFDLINIQYLAKLLDSGLDSELTVFANICLAYENEIYNRFGMYGTEDYSFLQKCDDIMAVTNKLRRYLKCNLMMKDNKEYCAEEVIRKLLCVCTAKKYLELKYRYEPYVQIFREDLNN